MNVKQLKAYIEDIPDDTVLEVRTKDDHPTENIVLGIYEQGCNGGSMEKDLLVILTDLG